MKNMRFLRRLQLRTILSLIPESTPPSRDLLEFCNAENIRHACHHVEKYDDHFSHTPKLVATLLSEFIDPSNHPLLVHCRDGGHNTGLVIMCLRRLQNWNLPSIMREFIRYTKNNFISFEEKRFVESFTGKVSIPLFIPKWLWNGVRHGRHPSIQLELQPDPSASHTSLLSPNMPSSLNTEKAVVLDASKPHHSQTDVRKQIRSRIVRVKVHYNLRIAALDVQGVHFAKCCRPDIDGDVNRTRGH